MTRAIGSFSSQADALAQVVEEVAEGEDLACASVSVRGHRGELAAVEKRRHRLDELGPHGPVALDEVGQSSEHDAAGHPLGQGLSEARARQRGPPPPALALLGRERHARPVAGACGDAVDNRLRVALEQLEKALPAPSDALERLGGDRDALALPRDLQEGVEIEIGARSEEHRHRPARLSPTVGQAPARTAQTSVSGERLS